MSNLHVDKNLVIDVNIKSDDLVWHNALNAPLEVFGVEFSDGLYRRMPGYVAKSVSEKVYVLHSNTSGGRIRFRTDSPSIAVFVRYTSIYRSSHFPLLGSAGLDLYVKGEGDAVEHYEASFMPPYDMEDHYASRYDFMDGTAMREVTVNMPLYSDVSEILIGVVEGSELLPPLPYTSDKKIVYYGNSITQGACASRPGNAFPTYASRAVGCDFINLGFSGSGRAEDEIAEYIAGLDMQIFVYDYDHNAPNPEYLLATHEKMFLKIREKHPKIPVVMLTRTSFKTGDKDRNARFEIIRKTYDNAVARGDENVYLIDGREVFGELWGEATVERLHPGDLGQILIGRALVPVLQKILGDFK